MSVCERASQWQRALHTLSTSPEMDAVCLNVGLRACWHGAKWAVALGLLTEMPSLSFQPDAIACGAALSALSVAGKQNLVNDVLMALHTSLLGETCHPHRMIIGAQLMYDWNKNSAPVYQSCIRSVVEPALSKLCSLRAAPEMQRWVIHDKLLEELLGSLGCRFTKDALLFLSLAPVNRLSSPC